jgi:hypothetical protein
MTTAALRSAAIALIVTLLCVPSLTRVGQTLDPTPAGKIGAGFSRDGNRPPDPVVVRADTSTTGIVVDPLEVAPVAGFLLLADETLPSAPLPAEIGALRAPPAPALL